MGRMRRKSPFIADKVWRYLRLHPGITARQVAERFHWSQNRTSCMLRNMREEGYARHGGQHQQNTQWYAVGDKPPECRSGTHPNTLANLYPSHGRWRETLAMAFVAAGRDPSVIGKGRPRAPAKFAECALAEAWKMPMSPTLGDD